MTGHSSVVTWLPPATPGGPLSQPRWLGTLGPVMGLNYSFAVGGQAATGGPDKLSLTLMREPDFRTDAMNAGRVVQVFRGGACVWDGKMLEPVPTDAGWQCSAVGLGNAPQDFSAVYTTWSNQNDAINQAITRGLRISNPGVSSSVWLGQQVDSASTQISDLLNLFCTLGGFYWYITVNPTGGGGILNVTAFPQGLNGPVSALVPNRLMTTQMPVGRTLGNMINTLWIRYQSSANNASAPVYSLTSEQLAGQASQFQPVETYEDISSAQHITLAQAQTLANQVLGRYVPVSYSGPFTLQQGELLTMGGQPIDLGCEQAGTIVQGLVTDFAYGGDVVPGPIIFLVGAYNWDDEAEQATVTPFQALDTSFSGLLSALSAYHSPGGGTAHQEVPPKPKPKPPRKHTVPLKRHRRR